MALTVLHVALTVLFVASTVLDVALTVLDLSLTVLCGGHDLRAVREQVRNNFRVTVLRREVQECVPHSGLDCPMYAAFWS